MTSPHNPAQQEAPDLSSAPPSDTLYASSPHQPIDKRQARRRLKQQHRAGQYADPTNITLIVLLLALCYWFLPIPGVFQFLYGRSKSPPGFLSAPIAVLQPKMPWQKQFTLSSRSKGCHLVTNEMMPHLEEGLKGTSSRADCCSTHADVRSTRRQDWCVDPVYPAHVGCPQPEREL